MAIPDEVSEFRRGVEGMRKILRDGDAVSDNSVTAIDGLANTINRSAARDALRLELEPLLPDIETSRRRALTRSAALERLARAISGK